MVPYPKLKRYVVTVTSNASQVGSGSTPVVNGRVLAIHYVKGDYANGVDIDIDTSSIGTVLYSADDVNNSVSVYPRVAVQDTGGTGVTYDGTNEIYEPIPVANETIDIAIAQAGATKTGTFHVIVESA